MPASPLPMRTQVATRTPLSFLQPEHDTRNQHASGLIEKEPSSDGEERLSASRDSDSLGDFVIVSEALDHDSDLNREGAYSGPSRVHAFVKHLIEQVIPKSLATTIDSGIQGFKGASMVTHSGNNYGQIVMSGQTRLHAGNVYSTIHKHIYAERTGRVKGVEPQEDGDYSERVLEAAQDLIARAVASARLEAVSRIPKQVDDRVAIFKDHLGNYSHIDARLVGDWEGFNYLLTRSLRHDFDDMGRLFRIPSPQRNQLQSTPGGASFEKVFRPGRRVQMYWFAKVGLVGKMHRLTCGVRISQIPTAHAFGNDMLNLYGGGTAMKAEMQIGKTRQREYKIGIPDSVIVCQLSGSLILAEFSAIMNFWMDPENPKTHYPYGTPPEPTRESWSDSLKDVGTKRGSGAMARETCRGGYEDATWVPFDHDREGDITFYDFFSAKKNSRTVMDRSCDFFMTSRK